MTSPVTIDTNVYKSRRKADTYLYVPKAYNLNDLPEALSQLLGELELVLHVTLDANRRLANADVREVMTELDRVGFYLQLPSEEAATC